MIRTIGIVSSSGGSALFELLPFLQLNDIRIIVVTDRECGIERKCLENKVTFQRFSYNSSSEFSRLASDFFHKNGVNDLVFLFFTRRIEKEIYNEWHTLNIHPALLPLFPGLNSIQKHISGNVRLIAATLHKVNEVIDGGEIIGQIANSYTIENIHQTSFLQKTFLTLSAIDSYIKTGLAPQNGIVKMMYINTNMALRSKADEYFKELEKKYNNRILSL